MKRRHHTYCNRYYVIHHSRDVRAIKSSTATAVVVYTQRVLCDSPYLSREVCIAEAFSLYSYVFPLAAARTLEVKNSETCTCLAGNIFLELPSFPNTCRCSYYRKLETMFRDMVLCL